MDESSAGANAAAAASDSARALRVYLVDDNTPFRRSTAMLLETSGIEVRDFGGGAQMLADLEREPAPAGACTASDMRMPGMSGLELLEEMKRRQVAMPVIFITAHADIPLAVEAMRRGASNFIEKPFDSDALIQAVRTAAAEGPGFGARAPLPQTSEKLAGLTPRERQVMELVVEGKLNKTIADVLGISTKTVELHRANLMTKLGVRNVPDLVKIFLGYR